MLKKSFFYCVFAIVLTITIVSISSCEKDQLFEEEAQNEIQFPQLKGSFVTGKDLLQTPIISSKIKSLASSVISKSANASGIQIDTTRIRLIQSDQYDSYTFQIIQDSIERKSLLRNYMITILNDTTTVQYLINYNLLNTRQYDMDNISMVRVEGDSLIPNFLKCGNTTLAQVPYIQCFEYQCSGETGGGGHYPGESCQATGSDQAGSTCVTRWTYIEIGGDCGGGGSTGTGNTGGGGGGTYVPVDPVDDDFSELEIFYNSLTTYLSTFILDNAQNSLKQQIEAFLQDENYSEAATSFAKKAIKTKWEDVNNEVDFDNKSIFHSSVPDCLKDIIKSFKPTNNGVSLSTSNFDVNLNQQLNIAGNILELFDNQGEYSLSFEVTTLPANRTTGNVPNARTIPNFITVNGEEKLESLTIKFHDSYLSAATDLAVARTTVHELIHAYLFYILENNSISSLGQSLDILLNTVSQNTAQHTIMAEQFVGSIASAIERWDNSQSNHVQYDYMAWSGELMVSTEFLLLPESFQDATEQRISAEEGRLPRDPTITPITPISLNNCQ